VATASAADPDAGDALKFTLISDANGSFVIDASSGQISVSASALFDVKVASSYDLLVRVTDKAGLSFERGLRVNLQAAVREVEVAPNPTTPPADRPDAVKTIVPDAAVLKPEPANTPNAPAPDPAVAKLTQTSDADVAAAEDAKAGGGADGLLGKRTALDGADRGTESSSVLTRLRRREDGPDPTATATGLTKQNPTLAALMSFDLAAPPPNASDFAASAADRTANFDSAVAAKSLGHGLRRGVTVDSESDAAQQAAGIAIGTKSGALSLDQVFTSANVASVSFSAGFIWWLTRGGGLLTSMLMGVPAWRHVDLLPVLARNFDDEEDEDGLDAPLPQRPKADGHYTDIDNSEDANRARASSAAADNSVEGLFERGPELHAPHTPPPNSP
jgi:hypothetical protein